MTGDAGELAEDLEVMRLLMALCPGLVDTDGWCQWEALVAEKLGLTEEVAG